MCVNYRSAAIAAIEAIIAGDVQADLFAPREVWPRYQAPVILRSRQTGQPTAQVATFGLLPHWAKAPKIPQSTVNARSETVATLPSFRDAWRKAQFCLIPVSRYYEPNYESGKPIRWAISRTDAADFCVAGIWSWWSGRDGLEGLLSFAMLTVNCDTHPVLKRFHDPQDEKRSLVHLRPSEYEAWLGADPELARAMLTELPAPEELHVEAAPLPPRKKSTSEPSEL